jgi:hypothetical protein
MFICHFHLAQLVAPTSFSIFILRSDAMTVTHNELNMVYTHLLTFTTYDVSSSDNSRWKQFSDVYYLLTTALTYGHNSSKNFLCLKHTNKATQICSSLRSYRIRTLCMHWAHNLLSICLVISAINCMVAERGLHSTTHHDLMHTLQTKNWLYRTRHQQQATTDCWDHERQPKLINYTRTICGWVHGHLINRNINVQCLYP